MTAGSTVTGALDSGSERIIEDKSIADKSVSRDSESASPVKKPVDVHRQRVLDENFRLAVTKILSGISTIPNNWNDLTVREQRDWMLMKMKIHYPNMPDSLVSLWVGIVITGDCGQALTAAPYWLDRRKFQRGQRFAMDNYAGIMMTTLLTLYIIYSFDGGLKPLFFTGKSSEPFTSFKRYLSTVKRFTSWYSSDVWTAGTDGYRHMRTVRRMHANVREKLGNASRQETNEAGTILWSPTTPMAREDLRAACPAPALGQCPFASGNEKFEHPLGLNQFDMTITQFGFVSLVILYPESFGIHGASDEDLDAFCHVWRGLGYLLGIEDEFNFCNGTFEEVKQRSRDVIEYWVKPNLRNITPEWEHMVRCAVEGVNYYFPLLNFEQNLLYVFDMIGISMPRLRASISYIIWIRLNLMKFFFHWIARLPGVPMIMNRILMMRLNCAHNYSDDELAALRKRSKITLTKGLAETVAVDLKIREKQCERLREYD